MARNMQILVRTVNQLPTLPDIVTSINRVLADPNSSSRDIAGLIEDDLAISSKLLKVVNSARYGFKRQITNINQAIVGLGFETVRDIALSIALFDSLGREGRVGHFDRTLFWEHCIAVGVASREIAATVDHKGADLAYLAGLLHDIGKVVTDVCAPEDFVEVIDTIAGNDIPMIQAEERVFGYHHGEVGLWLGERWKLPEAVVECIGYHHNPHPGTCKADFPLAAIVHLADIFVRALDIGNGGDSFVPGVKPAVAGEFPDFLEYDSVLACMESIRCQAGRATSLISAD